MRPLRTLLLALGLACGLAAGEAPGRYTFKTYGPEQGFTEPGLTTMAQDAEGCLWIGGDSGLVRYDGVYFRKWTARQGLPSTTVNRVLPRAAGGIWVMTEGGLARLVAGVCTPVLMGGRPFHPVRGSALDRDGAGGLWALGVTGLFRQAGDTMEPVPGLPVGGRALACRPSTGTVFAAVNGQVWERRADGTWATFTARDGLPTDGIECLAVDGTGRLWVVGTRTLRYQDPGGTSFKDVSAWLPGPPFASCTINRGPDGSVGVPTNAGLLTLKGEAHQVIDEAVGLPTRWTVSSLVDREGNLWVLGPTLFRQLGQGFTRTFTVQDGLPSDLVWRVFRDRSGKLFAGTSAGLATLGAAGWTRVEGTGGLSVTSLVQDARGRLLVGCNNAPLHTLEPGAARVTDAFFRGLKCDQPIPPDRSQSLVAARDGSLWVCDPVQGVFRVEPGGNRLRLDYGPVQARVANFAAWELHEDRQGRIWGATNSGVIIRDGDGWHRFGKGQGLEVDPLNTLAEAADGSFWVLYREPRGLSRVEYRDGTFRVLEHRDLGATTLYAGAVDARGALWLGTDRGVAVVQGGAIAHLDRGGGLAGDDCSQGALLVEPDQEVWVGTSTGLSRILPGRPAGTSAPLGVEIVSVDLGHDRITPPYGPRDPVRHRDATLEFRFAAPTFVNEKEVQYQVRLVGLEDDWRTTDVPQARYVALPGGAYRFEVRAAYPGAAFGPPAGYPFRVLPPWWRTWWCLALEILAGLGLASLATNRRLATLARQKERLAGMVEQATRDLLKANQALEKANVALKSQSLSDPLTSLHNRRFLAMVVDDDIAKVQRSYRDWTAGQPLPNNDLVFLMVDLDHFKAVNDTYGHHVGDQVLEIVANALRKAARETDGVIRWGGEEFLVMARNSTRAEAPLLAERIRSLMAEQRLTLESGEVLRWTCSVGYACYPFALEDLAWLGWERVVEIADACLYLAKRGGRNAWAGAEALPGLARAAHGPRLPWELLQLRDEGVIELKANRAEVVRRGPRSGEVFG